MNRLELVSLLLVFFLITSCAEDFHPPRNLFDISSIDAKEIISTIGSGYNIFKGNPMADTKDPGLIHNTIFDLEFDDENKIVQEGKWNIPKGIEQLFSSPKEHYNPDQTYYEKTYTEEFTNKDEYISILKSSICVSEGFPIGSFSATSQYNEISKKFITKDSLFFVKETSQIPFSDLAVSITNSTHPLFNQDFIENLLKLEQCDHQEACYHDFFDKFGTHIVTKVKSGFIEKQVLEGSSSQFLQTPRKILNLAIHDDFELNTYQDTTCAEFDSKAVSNFMIYRRVYYVEEREPLFRMPPLKIGAIELSLVTYGEAIDLFTQRFKSGLSITQINTFKENFHHYMNTYCSIRLSEQEDDESKKCSFDHSKVLIDLSNKEIYYEQADEFCKEELESDQSECTQLRNSFGGKNSVNLLLYALNANEPFYMTNIESGLSLISSSQLLFDMRYDGSFNFQFYLKKVEGFKGVYNLVNRFLEYCIDANAGWIPDSVDFYPCSYGKTSQQFKLIKNKAQNMLNEFYLYNLGKSGYLTFTGNKRLIIEDIESCNNCALYKFSYIN